MKKIFSAACVFVLLFAAANNLLSQPTSSTLRMVAHLNPAAPGIQYSEVAGCGDLAIIGAFSNNSYVWIYDIADKSNPVQLAAIYVARSVRDVQVHGRYLFVSYSNGMEWYDILDPRQPKLVIDFRPAPGLNAHTFFVSGNTLYIADYFSRGVRIFDITDKKNPKPMVDILDPAWGIHDVTIIRGRLYAAWISGQSGMSFVDVSNPAKPRELAKVRYPQAGTHNAWPTEDKQYILTTDEVGGTRHNLKIWDARTPGRLTQVAEFGVGVSPASTIHNVYVRGRYAYISYYCEGVRIVDIADPTKPQEVAFYDFNGNAPCSGYFSNWGVYPFSNLIYASDLQSGLYVMEFPDHPPANIAGQVVDAKTNAPVPGAMVYFLDEYPTSRTNAAGRFDIPWFKNDTVRVATEAMAYRPDTSIVVTTVDGKISPTIRLIPLTTNVAQPNAGPDEFALLAHPNPFSLKQLPQTQIVFRLPHREQVQIEIFNLLGQRVRHLLNAPREQGQHNIFWDGTTNTGQMVATGVYLLQLRAGKFSVARRLTVVE
jgi:hypothetical protein